MLFLHQIVIGSQVPAPSHFSTPEKLNYFSQIGLPEDRWIRKGVDFPKNLRKSVLLVS